MKFINKNSIFFEKISPFHFSQYIFNYSRKINVIYLKTERKQFMKQLLNFLNIRFNIIMRIRWKKFQRKNNFYRKLQNSFHAKYNGIRLSPFFFENCLTLLNYKNYLSQCNLFIEKKPKFHLHLHSPNNIQ